jgi:hypothetical protein
MYDYVNQLIKRGMSAATRPIADYCPFLPLWVRAGIQD